MVNAQNLPIFLNVLFLSDLGKHSNYKDPVAWWWTNHSHFFRIIYSSQILDIKADYTRKIKKRI